MSKREEAEPHGLGHDIPRYSQKTREMGHGAAVLFDNSLLRWRPRRVHNIIAMERILVIDDDVELCHLVGEYLRAEGFTIECVHDGESGLKKATARGVSAGGARRDVAGDQWV